jgi:hypothetical protein
MGIEVLLSQNEQHRQRGGIAVSSYVDCVSGGTYSATLKAPVSATVPRAVTTSWTQ